MPVLDVCARTGLSEVRYIPNARPGHRGQPTADSVHRWKMTALALSEYSKLIPDDREIQRSGVSYMVPTLRSMRSEFGLRPLCLILGLDAFLQIHRWYWWAEVLRLANIVVMTRPGASHPRHYPKRIIQAFTPRTRVLFECMAGHICTVSVLPVDISATQLRFKLRIGGDTTNYLPKNVAQYIDEHRLYVG